MKKICIVFIVFCKISSGWCQTSKAILDVERAIKTVTEDYPEKEQLEAYDALSKFALQGDFDARVFLGCEYLTGVRVEKNIDLGLAYLQEGVEGGSVNAMFCISKHYYRESNFDAYLKTLEKCSQADGVFCKRVYEQKNHN